MCACTDAWENEWVDGKVGRRVGEWMGRSGQVGCSLISQIGLQVLLDGEAHHCVKKRDGDDVLFFLV